ncbi:MAG TPA: hypothetical protein VMR50_21720 [Myxococcota bacterium]|nr:hypothetical protein [Myxococcota bacterium]
MRVEYAFDLSTVDIPYFSVESMEGPEKLFRLVTLVMNVLYVRPRVDVIFHSPNRDDLPKKISAFEAIVKSAPAAPALEFRAGNNGSLGSSYYSWVSIHSNGARAASSPR